VGRRAVFGSRGRVGVSGLGWLAANVSYPGFEEAEIAESIDEFELQTGQRG
jgi:hypothetical protein